nr:PREDICTED: odorant receptor 49a-like [Megachile rotundata]
MVMYSLPIILAVSVILIQLLNHNINRKKFDHMFDRMSQLWEIAEMNGEVEVLKEVTDEGSQMGSMFRSSIWIFTIFFLSMPLCPIFLDFILPLNETRAREPLFKLNYMVDMRDHFFIEYFHSAFSSIVVVLITATFDSLYMVIIHYGCGLFALCGYQVKKAAEIAGTNATICTKNDLFRRCVITHHEAIRFYECMDESTRTGYLIQVVLTMIAFTVNAVQAVLHMDRPNEFIAILMFMCGQQFHQFALCLPGQVLIDRSLDLINDIYSSKWYQTPVKYQRTILTMQIRCSKACKLTAGGFYEMNMENFGAIIKTSVSYFTVLLSLRS